MIAYVDKMPAVDPLNGLFLITLESGGEKVQVLLTRYALQGLEHGCTQAKAKAAISEMDAEPVPFRKARQRRRKPQ